MQTFVETFRRVSMCFVSVELRQKCEGIRVCHLLRESLYAHSMLGVRVSASRTSVNFG